MESKKMIRIGMKLSEAIIEILKKNSITIRKEEVKDEKKQRHVKRNRKGGR